MTTTINGSYPAVNSDTDATINGLTVGKGSGAVSGSTALGNGALAVNTTGINTASGYQSLYSVITGTGSTAFGNSALKFNTANYNNAFGENALVFNTSGTFNSAFGTSALQSNTTASNNTAVGYQAGYTNSTGEGNVYLGKQSGYSTNADNNTGVGISALYATTSGASNTSIGSNSLRFNTTGGSNVAVGQQALYSNISASNNTAVGYQAGYTGTTATQNAYFGFQAGRATTGQYNTFIGAYAGESATVGNYNTFIGRYAGNNATSSDNTFVGNGAGVSITSGGANTIIGQYGGNQSGLDIRTASNYIVLSDGNGNPRITVNASGDVSVGTVSNISTEKFTVVTSVDSVAAFFRNSHATSADVVLGLWTDAAKDTTNSILIGINNAQAGNGRVIDIYGNGNIQNLNNSYGALSDVKLKENIVDATPKLNDLMKVKVRNYNLIGDTNKQIGVVAQELETVFAGLIDETEDTDRDGNALGTTTKSVKYSVFVPMLIKAIQELKAEVDAQALEIATLKGK
jgi:hypothetical protein